jgi:membrane protease YdiL (CAAX protease family)
MFTISLALLIVSVFNELMGALYYFLTILICLLLWLFVDRQEADDLGLRFTRRWWFGLVLGLLLGGGMMAGIVVLELALGWVNLIAVYTVEQGIMIGGVLAVYVIWQCLVAFAEEVVGRGYIQQNLNTRATVPLAVGCSALMFATLHLPSILMQSLPLVLVLIMVFNLTLGGVLLGWAFVKNRTLWLPIGIHFAWNFIQYHVVGFGFISQGVYTVQNYGWEIVTGGVVGPEAGLIGTLALLFLLLVLWRFPSRWLTGVSEQSSNET